LRGQVHTFDCFHDDRVPVTLNVEISLAPCARSDRRRLLLAVSPRPRGDPVWEALAERRDAFHCD